MAPDMNTQTVDTTTAYGGFYAPGTTTTAPAQPQPAVQPQPQYWHRPQYQPYDAQNPGTTSYGQLYQYQQPIPYTQMYHPEPPYDKKWSIGKDALQFFSMVCCIICICLVLSMIGTNLFTVGVYANVPLSVFALAWGIAEIIVRFRNKFEKFGIHPGAHVAMSLLVWLSASAVGGVELVLVSIDRSWRYDDSSLCWDDDIQDFGECGDYFEGHLATFEAVAAFTAILWAIHFALFVGACVDTAKRNAWSRSQVMIVQAPHPGWQPMAPPPVVHQPPPPPPPQQPEPIPLQTRAPSDHWAPSSVHSGTNSPVNLPPRVKEFYTPQGSGQAH